MKLWCVINMAVTSEAEVIGMVSYRLPKAFGPTCFYEERKDAEDELIRLKMKYPAGDFYLFEAMSRATSSQIIANSFHIDEVH